MEYNKIIINNNLLHYTNEDNNNYISSENLSKNSHIIYNRNINPNQFFSLKDNSNNLLYNHNEINERQNIIDNNLPFSSRGNYRIKNNIYSIGNIEKTRVNKTPQAGVYKRLNFGENEIDFNSHDNNFDYNINHEFNDIRVDYCLQMLNLNNIKNIFHKKNIGFKEMLYLSQNDMKKMGIPKYSQLIIQKFTKDYLEKASFYTAEELEKFFQLYFRKNIRKIISNKNIEIDFPVRSFSPIVYNNKNLLNKYDYDLYNINDSNNINEKRNNNKYKHINRGVKNNINNNHKYYNTNFERRNCLSASQRRKTHDIRRKGNINKNIRFFKSSNLYPNSKRLRNISSLDSMNFINSSPVHKVENLSLNNYIPNKNNKYESTNIRSFKNINGENHINQKNNINKKVSEISNNLENYLNNLKHNKKMQGKFDTLNLAINNFYKEYNKKSKVKSSIQKKMNKNNFNANECNFLLKNIKINKENKEKKHFNSFENLNKLQDNYFNRKNNSEIRQNSNFNDNNFEQINSANNNNMHNSNIISFDFDNYFTDQININHINDLKSKNRNNNQNYRKISKNSIKKNNNNDNNNNFIINKNRSKSQRNNFHKNNEKKTYNTSVAYKNNDSNKNVKNNLNNIKNCLSFSGYSINLIKNNII